MEQKIHRRRSENKAQRAVWEGAQREMRPRHGVLPVVLSAIWLALFALFFFEHNTPLGPSIGSDNAIYLTMGTMLADGAAPYTEVFDHKGPVLFLLQAIPQAIAGGYSTLGVFVMEALFTLGCMLTLGHIGRRMRMHSAAILGMQMGYLTLLAPILIGGNYCEEYTNLFTLVGVDWIVGLFAHPQLEIRWPKTTMLFSALGVGAMATLAFLTRANNALPLAMMVLALAICLIASGKLLDLLLCIVGFVGGCAVVAAPIALWLNHHGALSEAIYASFTHNLMYAETEGRSRIQMLLGSPYGWYAIALAAMACLGALAFYAHRRAVQKRDFLMVRVIDDDRQRREKPMRHAVSLAFVFGAAGAGMAAFISHKFYEHYLILGAPLAIIGAGVCLSLICEKMYAIRRRGPRLAASLMFAIALSAAVVAPIGYYGVEAITRRSADHAVFVQLQAQTQTLLAHVPEEERDRLMAYRVEPKWYVAAEEVPCMRFYFLQEILAQADPAVMDEIVETFEDEPPLWLVIFYNRAFGPPYDERVAEIFETRYEFVDAVGEYQLLRLKKQNAA